MSEIIDISNLEETPSSNFGGGVELLMNNNKSSEKNNTYTGLNDLDDLEKELNDLGNVNGGGGGGGGFGGISSGVSFDNRSDGGSVHLNIDEDDDVPINLGAGTSAGMDSGKTWDDYGKYTDIPASNGFGGGGMSGTSSSGSVPEPRLSREEQRKEQYRMIRELEDWERKSNGKIQLSKKYTMESPFHEVRTEYEALKEDAAKKASIKFQGGCLKMLISGIEYLNGKFDPFDVNLDGWGDKVDDDMEDYDDIFSQLYEKYKSRGSVAPELKLLFQLGGSAFMVNLSNKIFKTAAPGMDDVFRQNPELMRSFQNAAINTMGQNNPGIGNFMSGITQSGPGPSGGMSQRMSGPPPPMPTQGQYAEPPPPNRGGNNNRPDLAAARPMQTRGPLNSMQSAPPVPASRPPGPRNVPPSQQSAANSAMNLALGSGSGPGANSVERSARQPRAEMKGPSDISSLLSGIKTRTIPAPEPRPPPSHATTTATIDDAVSQISNESVSIAPSMISGKSGKSGKAKRGRKPKSDKNTVSMDL